METERIINGSRQVIICVQPGACFARLYVDNGNVATPTCWKGKTFEGAQRWALKVLAAY